MSIGMKQLAIYSRPSLIRKVGPEVVQIRIFSEPVQFELRAIQFPFDALRNSYEYHLIGLLADLSTLNIINCTGQLRPG